MAGGQRLDRARLLERVGRAVRTGSIVSRVARDGTAVARDDTRRSHGLADAVIVAAPLLRGARIVEGARAGAA